MIAIDEWAKPVAVRPSLWLPKSIHQPVVVFPTKDADERKKHRQKDDVSRQRLQIATRQRPGSPSRYTPSPPKPSRASAVADGLMESGWGSAVLAKPRL